ncbi:6-phosphogluconolactonase (cycloisomerase 2 family) [Murinocardiopsis flavida]|uniref:6-phosphogluconolactonase (Cycloisomerase 2 family) n=1 Tax=Murinocardiopsis flavida TaxID=645275 RepID=A0A2P8D5A8_9ACTN|nr:lactonase family protein [Murinocardiopsis flavida]PSK92379.1 6-phosphogluconolactonase (cycloisomerase 2 family) [Murinocardiopsis flavida]
MGERRLLWVGSYTPGSEPAGAGSGVHRVWLDTATGALTDGGLAAAAEGPSFLALHPTRPLLFAVNEAPEGRLSGFATASDGTLTPLGSVGTGGGSPCHLAVLDDCVVVANYAEGVVSVHPIGADGAPGERVQEFAHDGTGPVADRQECSHAHSADLSPGGTHLLVCDLGTDELRAHPYTAGAAEPLGPQSIAVRCAPGTGPRHLAVHPSGHIYVGGELDGAVHVLRWDPATATAAPVSSAPATATGGRTLLAEVTLSADARRLYVSNRVADTVAVFDVAADGAALHPAGEAATEGVWPRHFTLAGDLLIAANQDPGSLETFRLDPATGVPAATGNRLDLPSAVCVLPAR